MLSFEANAADCGTALWQKITVDKASVLALGPDVALASSEVQHFIIILTIYIISFDENLNAKRTNSYKL